MRRGVREQEAAHYVSDGPHMGLSGVHQAVHLDEPALDFDLRGLEAEVLGVGRTPGGHEDGVRRDLGALAAVRADRDGHAVLPDDDRARVEAGVDDDAHAAALERALELGADLRVLERDKRRQVLEQRDLDAEVMER
ncbi:MAG: hypothetical protein U0838_07350 [Chloroflexota bacterium]